MSDIFPHRYRCKCRCFKCRVTTMMVISLLIPVFLMLYVDFGEHVGFTDSLPPLLGTPEIEGVRISGIDGGHCTSEAAHASDGGNVPGYCHYLKFMQTQDHPSSTMERYGEAFRKKLRARAAPSKKDTNGFRLLLLLQWEDMRKMVKGDVGDESTAAMKVLYVRPVAVLPGISLEKEKCADYRRKAAVQLRSGGVTKTTSPLFGDLLAAVRSGDNDDDGGIGGGEGPLHRTASVPPVALSRITTGMGPDWLEGAMLLNSTLEIRLVALMFRFVRENCVYEAPLINIGAYAVNITVWVDHLYRDYNALRETLDSFLPPQSRHRVQPLLFPTTPRAATSTNTCLVNGMWSAHDSVVHVTGSVLQQQRCVRHGAHRRAPDIGLDDGTGLQSYSGPIWVEIGDDPVKNYKEHPVYKRYFRVHRLMRSASYYEIAPQYNVDLLGRMNLGKVFEWRSGASNGHAVLPRHAFRGYGHVITSSFVYWSPPNRAAAPHGSPSLKELLSDRRVYFIGDSHVRLMFYALLSRYNLTKALDGNWRYSNVTHVPEYNTTFNYVNTYVLDVNNPSVIKAFSDSSAVLIMGVGQHHSNKCLALTNHTSYVDNVFRKVIFSNAVNNRDACKKGPPYDARLVIWLGVPAYPINKFVFLNRPIGLKMRDCRNNGRHLLYTAVEHRVVMWWSQWLQKRRDVVCAHASHASHEGTKVDGGSRSTSRGLRLRFLDLFAFSYGMQHTTLDGVHYYSWVREFWVDSALAIIHEELWQSS